MELEDLANHLNDLDASWHPFLFLRPQEHERLSNRKVALLAVLYGLPAGLVVDILLRVTGAEHVQRLTAVMFPFALMLGFFAVYRFTFAVAWNRRADRLISSGAHVLSARARAWRESMKDAENSAEASEEQ